VSHGDDDGDTAGDGGGSGGAKIVFRLQHHNYKMTKKQRQDKDAKDSNVTAKSHPKARISAPWP